MCMSTPDIPAVPERQAAKLPDNGAPAGATDTSRRRRAIMAGILTSANGALGSPAVAKPTLG